MRLKINLKSDNSIFIPFNYNHILSSIIYGKINDLELAKKLHSVNTFKFFTFSQLNIKQRTKVGRGLISKNGEMSFQISSPNDYLIKSLVEGFLNELIVNFKGNNLFVEKVELLANPKFENSMNVKTLSPIIVRTKKEVDGVLKTWDLRPSDHQFYYNLEKNLIRKYNEFYNKEESVNNIHISSDTKSVKGKRIIIRKYEAKTFHRAFLMDLILEGDEDIIKFGYDCGLGEKNSMGFGMLRSF